MSNFECWVRANEVAGCGMYPLEVNGTIRLYQTKKQYFANNRDFYTTPVYHVWADDHSICSTQNYLEAYHVWESYCKEKGLTI